MTYRVGRSASTYELQNGDPNGEPYLHYIHSGPQSSSVANIQQLTTLHRQQQQPQQQQQQHYVSDDANQTELHRFSQNADRFTTNQVRSSLTLFPMHLEDKLVRINFVFGHKVEQA